MDGLHYSDDGDGDSVTKVISRRSMQTYCIEVAAAAPQGGRSRAPDPPDVIRHMLDLCESDELCRGKGLPRRALHIHAQCL